MPRRPYERRGGPTKVEWVRAQETTPARGSIERITKKKTTPAAELHPCKLRGGVIGTTPCEVGCRAQIKVYACQLFEKATLSPRVTSIPFCGMCEQRQPHSLT